MAQAAHSNTKRPGFRQPIVGYTGHVPGLTCLNMHGGSWRNLLKENQQTPRPSTETVCTFQDESGVLQDTWSSLSRVTFGQYDEKNFLPRMDRIWTPPLVGYSGFIPGYSSGNMHGSPWKELVAPTPRDHISITPRGRPPGASMAKNMLSSPRRPRKKVSNSSAMSSPRLPNNIVGYLKTQQHRF
jgi:hypothetical protein